MHCKTSHEFWQEKVSSVSASLLYISSPSGIRLHPIRLSLRQQTEEISTLEIHFWFFRKEFREGTYPPLWGVPLIFYLLRHDTLGYSLQIE